MEQPAPSSIDDAANTKGALAEHPVESSEVPLVEGPLQIPAEHNLTEGEPHASSELGTIGPPTETSPFGFVPPHNIASTETFEPSTAAWDQSEAHDSKKGWSSWKTRIQTFFRKLFG